MNQTSTINTEEVNRFSAQSQHWWDETGPFKPLHQMNPTRLGYIRDNVLKHMQRDSLQGLRILDVGCGGGVLTEPLCRQGATVMGIDASAAAIDVAQQHSATMQLDIAYECSAIEDLSAEHGGFDVITALEIIEHVDQPKQFIEACLKRLKPGGLIFFSTINKTRKSYMKAIVAAEYILRMIPRGTHDWNKFITPAELANYLRPHGYMLLDSTGLLYNPITGEWSMNNDHSANYICCVGEA